MPTFVVGFLLVSTVRAQVVGLVITDIHVHLPAKFLNGFDRLLVQTPLIDNRRKLCNVGALWRDE
jgi:hypothetical protein